MVTIVNNEVWWCTTVIPATWEMEVGGLWFEAGLGKSVRPSSEKQTK
jgi:hypothetical protein